MDNIIDKLPEIAASGFKYIQTSPMQPQKDYYAGGNWKGEWWKLYQPLGFCVASKDNALGTKSDLQRMCDEAEKLGIKVIVDIVSNHLGGGGSESFHSGVKEYEPELYDGDYIHKGYGYVSDGNVRSLVRGHLGEYPDVKTEEEVVQQAVLDMLKEYVDVGVDGFRFDAAKHIETPYDGEYASGYWPTVIEGINEYANRDDDPLFIYGEILNTPGDNRDINWYTEYIGITDTWMSDGLRSCVTSGNFQNVASNLTGYDVSRQKKVIWGESHDTYSNDSQETTNISQNQIDRVYAIETSMSSYSTLYFARPESGTTMGNVGSLAYTSNHIKAVNEFRNRYSTVLDNIHTDSGLFYNLKANGDDIGLLIVGEPSEKSLTMDIPEGRYVDQVTGNVWTASSGSISGELGNSGIAVLHLDGEGSEISGGETTSSSSMTEIIPDNTHVVRNIPDTYLDGNDVYAWVWPNGGSGRFVGGTLSGNSFSFEVTEDDAYFLLAICPSTVSSPTWDDVLYQSDDQTLKEEGTCDASSFSWR